MTKTLFFALLLSCSLAGLAQPKTKAARIQEVENNLIPYVPVKGFKGWNIYDRMKYYRVPGVSIAVIHNYQIDWAKGYGLADTSTKRAVTTSTTFSAGSVSKWVMAIAALKMADQGLIQLDSPINHYLRSWKLAATEFSTKTPVTLRMLLSHSGGTSQASYFGFTPEVTKLPSIVEIVSGAPNSASRPVVVNSGPNTEFRYSGGGSMVAQLALMDIRQQNFHTLTQELLFKPMGLNNSSFEQPLSPEMQAKAAWAYSSATWFKGMPYVYPQQAAAGLYSTPTDLSKLIIDVQRSLQNKGKLLSQAMAQTMMQPRFTVSEGGYLEQIGTGPFLLQLAGNKDPNQVYFEFTGVNAGFLAYVLGSVTDGNGVVIMMNSGDDVNGLGKEIRRAVAQTYQWKGYLPAAVNPIELPDTLLNSYVGRYRKAIDEVVYIRKEKNYLVEQINQGNDIYCFTTQRDSVVFTDYNIKGFFTRDSLGNVNGLQTAYQQQPMPRMRNDEFSPTEYLQQKQYAAAKIAFTNLHLNEYQITYRAYDAINQPQPDWQAVQVLLEVAEAQHPTNSIVYARWGDFYRKQHNKTAAIRSYQKAIELDPTDEDSKQQLKQLLQ